MILTFYKPRKVQNKAAIAKPFDEQDSPGILTEVFDACLSNGVTSFTSEALFNRLIIELWRRRALGCLNLNRQEFASRLEQRGWNYNARTHLWSKAGSPRTVHGEMMLFED
jgi:hypothetical protein